MEISVSLRPIPSLVRMSLYKAMYRLHYRLQQFLDKLCNALVSTTQSCYYANLQQIMLYLRNVQDRAKVTVESRMQSIEWCHYQLP